MIHSFLLCFEIFPPFFSISSGKKGVANCINIPVKSDSSINKSVEKMLKTKGIFHFLKYIIFSKFISIKEHNWDKQYFCHHGSKQTRSPPQIQSNINRSIQQAVQGNVLNLRKAKTLVKTGQCEEEYGHMGTLCPGKLYKIKEIKESYIKCARKAQAAKLEMIKGTV